GLQGYVIVWTVALAGAVAVAWAWAVAWAVALALAGAWAVAVVLLEKRFRPRQVFWILGGTATVGLGTGALLGWLLHRI
ncbi:MAG: hypothetical protein AAGE59_38460, partial [Cyanobacteria bacterium P01_F01_bin.86]